MQGHVDDSLLIYLVSLVQMRDEEQCLSIVGEHLKGAVSQQVSTLVHLTYRVVCPLGTARVAECGVTMTTSRNVTWTHLIVTLPSILIVLAVRCVGITGS